MWKAANQSLIGAWHLVLNRPDAMGHFRTDRRPDRYGDFIVAYNWSSVFWLIVLTVASSLAYLAGTLIGSLATLQVLALTAGLLPLAVIAAYNATKPILDELITAPIFSAIESMRS